MSNIGSYEERAKDFDWSVAKSELSYKDGDPVNIGYICSDRNCELGLGDKLALIWESFSGEVKKFTFQDLKTHSNSFAHLLKEKLGLSGFASCGGLELRQEGGRPCGAPGSASGRDWVVARWAGASDGLFLRCLNWVRIGLRSASRG